MNIDTMATVLHVACLTEDRSPDEQRAMLDAALRIDCERAAFVVTNKHWRAPEMVAEVEATYDPSVGSRVTLNKAERARYDRLLRECSLHPACWHPMGAHYDGGRCPTTANR